MPLPLAGIAAGAVIGGALSPISSFFGAVAEPGILKTRYDAFGKLPLVLPPIEALLELGLRQFVPDEVVGSMLLSHGVKWGGPLDYDINVGRQNSRAAWNALTRLRMSRPDASFLMAAHHAARIDDASFGKLMRHAGADPEAWEAVRKVFRNTPPVELGMSAWARKVIDAEQWEQILRLHSAATCDWQPVLESYFNWLSLGDLIVARNRGIIDVKEWDRGLDRLGYGDPEHRRVANELRVNLPPYTDIIHMMIKEVFDADVVLAQRQLEEYSPEAEKWFERLGYTAKFPLKNLGGRDFGEISTGQALWAAHWRPVARGDSETMLHRLRPDRVAHYAAQLSKLAGQQIELKPYGIEEHRRALRVNDYMPFVRDSLAAVAFRPLRLVDIRHAYLGRVRDRAWFINQQMDRGIAPDDAETLADIEDRGDTIAMARRIRGTGALAAGQSMRAAISAYETGVMTRDQSHDALLLLGIDPQIADSLLNSADSRVVIGLVTRALTTLRRQYVNGELSRDETLQQLVVIGVAGPRGLQHLTAWDLDRTRTRRQLTTAKIQKYVAEGLLPVPEAIRRLTNLGWSNPDQLLLIQEAQASGIKIQQREAAAVERQRKAQAAELERLIRQQQAQLKRLQAELAKSSPATKLQAWLKKGIVGVDFFRSRLLAMGYDPTLVDEWEREALGNGQPP